MCAFNARVSASEKPTRIRGFTNAPYEEGELSAGFSWAGDHVSVDLNATGAYEPLDGKEARADGSRIAVDWGNVTFAASTMDRWWGPGWDGSLILSNNARPIPSLTIGRNRTHAFETKWLSWLGPWDIEVMFRSDGRRSRHSEREFLRHAFHVPAFNRLRSDCPGRRIWCGDGRPCGFDTFWDMFLGKRQCRRCRHNARKRTRQSAGRYSICAGATCGSASRRQFTLQAIGEDEAGGFPSRYTALVGIETSGYIKNRWSYRWYAELAGTSCDFVKTDIWNCAYNHGIYETGYRYHGRVVGHGLDNDSQVVSTGFVLVSQKDTQWHALIRAGDLNRGGALDIRNSP